MAGPRVKMVVGALIALLGVWWYIPGDMFNGLLTPYSSLTNLESLVAGVQGSVGLIAIIVGLFVVWIERDQMKLRRELQSQEVGERIQQTVQTVAEGGENEEEEHDSAVDADESTDESFDCEQCGKSFDTQRGLSVHKSKTH